MEYKWKYIASVYVCVQLATPASISLWLHSLSDSCQIRQHHNQTTHRREPGWNTLLLYNTVVVVGGIAGN